MSKSNPKHWFSFNGHKVELLGPPEIEYHDDVAPLRLPSLGRARITISDFDPGPSFTDRFRQAATAILEDQRIEASRHEAGHAVVALELGVGVLSARIFETPCGLYAGDVRVHAERVDLDWYPGMCEQPNSVNRLDVMAVLYAGTLAQFGRPSDNFGREPGGADREQIEQLDRDGALRDRPRALALDLVQRRWEQIENVAAALRKRGRLTGAEVMAAMRGAAE